MNAILRAAVTAAAILPSISALASEAWPNKPMRLVVPWPPGGVTDVMSRTLGAGLAESLGQQVVVDNRSGAAGTLGVAILAKARPDGYTLMMTDVPSHAISATIYAKLPYDPVKDVEPVALPSRSPMALVVHPKTGVNNVPRLIDLAKSRSGQLTFASSGPGSITHLAAERFKRDAKVDLVHVPYKGSGPATAAIVAGESAMFFSCTPPAIPHIKSERLVLLGFTSAQRSPLFPDTPTIGEVLPGFVMGCNTGFFVPGGTPRAIVQRLHAEIMKIVEQPRMKSVLQTNVAEAAPFTQAQFKEHVMGEMRDWGAIVKAANLKVD